MKIVCLLFLVFTFSACAETDPYKQLEPAPASADSLYSANAFNERWPRQFKCVQTVTIDFRLVTRTLVGYLIVQRPDKFRLQGMTEQGLKLFDITGEGKRWRSIFITEEMDARVIEAVARDIRRVFLTNIEHWVLHWGSGFYGGDAGPYLSEATVRAGPDGTRMKIPMGQREFVVDQVGNNALTTAFALRDGPHAQYEVRQYDWVSGETAETPKPGFPSPWAVQTPRTIVLRDRGISGPPYKLTIKVTELTVRDKPWPDKLFMPSEKDD